MTDLCDTIRTCIERCRFDHDLQRPTDGGDPLFHQKLYVWRCADAVATGHVLNPEPIRALDQAFEVDYRDSGWRALFARVIGAQEAYRDHHVARPVAEIGPP